MTELRRFIRHAEVYGTEFVFEAAMEDLADDELRMLARRLAHLNPKWRFPEGWSDSESGSPSPHPKAEKCHANRNPDSRGKLAVCAACGVTFTAVRSTARYHSDACRKRANRRVAK